jgi:hypothetical protein
MDTNNTMNALAIVCNLKQGELIEKLKKEKREKIEFYNTMKNKLLRLREYHTELRDISDYTTDDKDEDGYDYRNHNELVEIINSILIEEYGNDV